MGVAWMPYKDRGKWRGVVKVNGKRYSDSFLTKRESIAWEKDFKDKLLNSKLTTFDYETFATKYLEFARARFAKSVFEEKIKLKKDFLQFIGSNLPLDQITPRHIQDYLLKQAKTRSAYASNRDRKNLLAMWNWGIKILDLPSNPVSRTFKLPHDRKPQYVPPEQDVLRLMAVANRKERAFLDCYLCTGARRSEIFRLKWEDVNFEKREIRLLTRKTKDGSMEGEQLPINDQLFNSLKWIWENRKYKDSPFVWLCGEGPHSGKPFTHRNRYLRGLCKRAGIKPFGFHSLRRYVASVLADTHKISAKTIQRILRHKSVSTTERYIQNLNRDLSGVMGLLELNFGNNTTQSTTEEREDSGGITNS